MFQQNGRKSLGDIASSANRGTYRPSSGYTLSKKSKRAVNGGKRNFDDFSKCTKQQLNRDFVNIDGYGKVEEVILIAFEDHQTLSPRNMAGVWTRLSRLLKSCSRSGNQGIDTNTWQYRMLGHQLSALVARTMDGIYHLHEYGPIELCKVSLSMARIIKTVGVCGSMRAMSRNEMFRDALIGHDTKKKEVIFQAIASAAVALLPRLDPQGYSNLAYACAIAGAVPKFKGKTLFAHIADAIIARGHFQSFKPQEPSNQMWAPHTISNMVWAFAMAEVPDLSLFEKVAAEVVSRHLGSFSLQNLSNIVWAFASAEVSDRFLFDKVSAELIDRRDWRTCNPQGLSNIVGAFAMAGVPDRCLFDRFAVYLVARRNLSSFNTQDISNIVWSYATAKIPHPPLFDKLAGVIIERKHEMTPTQLSNTLWAYATSGLVESPLFSLLPNTSAGLLHQCNCQALANIAWAYTVANVNVPAKFSKRLIAIAFERMNDFNAAELIQLHQWHLWQKKEKSAAGLPPVFEKKCYGAFVSAPTHASALQEDVVFVLHSIGLHPKEVHFAQSGYRLVALVELNDKKVSIEVDGPSHFIDREPTGNTILMRRQVAKLDRIELISVPYWEWGGLCGDCRKQVYLCSLLGI